VSVHVEWNADAFGDVVSGVMRGIETKGRRRLPSITCNVHRVTHAVTWKAKGETVSVTVEDACCDELENQLAAEASKVVD
jgi:hypothetical protein